MLSDDVMVREEAEEATPLVSSQRTRRIRLPLAAGVAMVVGALMLVSYRETGSRSSLLVAVAKPKGPASSLGRVCLMHVAAGADWIAVSDVVLPGKRAYASQYGYRMLEYVFEDASDLPQCCSDSDSFACTIGNVEYKYCALLDALVNGGAGAANVDTGEQCDYIFATDGDASLLPDAPPIDGLVSLEGLKADVALSAGRSTDDSSPRRVTSIDDISAWWNSGAMIWRNTPSALELVQGVLAFDDASYDGDDTCAADGAVGYGDQWALCGLLEAQPSLIDSSVILALPAPAMLQNVLISLFNSGVYETPGPLLADDEETDWPPQPGDDAFVINCAGGDPLGCVKFVRDYVNSLEEAGESPPSPPDSADLPRRTNVAA